MPAAYWNVLSVSRRHKLANDISEAAIVRDQRTPTKQSRVSVRKPADQDGNADESGDDASQDVSRASSSPTRPTTITKMPIMGPQGQGPLGGKSRCLLGIQPVAPISNSGRAEILARVAPDRDHESRRRLVGTSSTSFDCEGRFSCWERYLRSSPFGRGKSSYG